MLAWFLKQPESEKSQAMLGKTIKAGLLYSCRIQHRNGSFDQAYPFEQSYGATGFLLPDLLEAYQMVKTDCSKPEQEKIEIMLLKASRFLLIHDELHGLISNHLAGAALGLYQAGRFFNQPEFTRNAGEIVQYILAHQSTEGWYVEYGGADPGYQTLCMYYLAQVYQITQDAELRRSLEKSLNFLQYFIHPDGTFGGEYGSRRTEIYYPGGIALLSSEFPLAAQITACILDAIESGRTTNLNDIDMGNTAPLVGNYIKALSFSQQQIKPDLPFTQKNIELNYPEAGLVIKSTPAYYCVIGVSNGGVIKLFDKKTSTLVLDDCGLLGKTTTGTIISTQITNRENRQEKKDNVIECDSHTYRIPISNPSPFNFVLLRCANLSLMRLHFFNEWIKKILVKTLIQRNVKVPIDRKRKIAFGDRQIIITDTITKQGNISLKELTIGGKFTAIHMASARYFTPSQLNNHEFRSLDIDSFNKKGILEVTTKVDF